MKIFTGNIGRTDLEVEPFVADSTDIGIRCLWSRRCARCGGTGGAGRCLKGARGCRGRRRCAAVNRAPRGHAGGPGRPAHGGADPAADEPARIRTVRIPFMLGFHGLARRIWPGRITIRLCSSYWRDSRCSGAWWRCSPGVRAAGDPARGAGGRVRVGAGETRAAGLGAAPSAIRDG